MAILEYKITKLEMEVIKLFEKDINSHKITYMSAANKFDDLIATLDVFKTSEILGLILLICENNTIEFVCFSRIDHSNSWVETALQKISNATITTHSIDTNTIYGKISNIEFLDKIKNEFITNCYYFLSKNLLL